MQEVVVVKEAADFETWKKDARWLAWRNMFRGVSPERPSGPGGKGRRPMTSSPVAPGSATTLPEVRGRPQTSKFGTRPHVRTNGTPGKMSKSGSTPGLPTPGGRGGVPGGLLRSPSSPAGSLSMSSRPQTAPVPQRGRQP